MYISSTSSLERQQPLVRPSSSSKSSAKTLRPSSNMSRTLGNTIGATKGLREGCAEIVHTYPFQYNTAGVLEGVLLDDITASTGSPVDLEVSVQVITAFNNGVSA